MSRDENGGRRKREAGDENEREEGSGLSTYRNDISHIYYFLTAIAKRLVYARLKND